MKVCFSHILESSLKWRGFHVFGLPFGLVCKPRRFFPSIFLWKADWLNFCFPNDARSELFEDDCRVT